MRRKTALALITAAVVGPMSVLAGAAPASATEAHSPAIIVGKITGPDSTSHTDARWDVVGTDLGITWDNGSGEILAAFGDTFGPGGSNWRSNVLLRSSDHRLSDGLSFDSAVVDSNGNARQLIPSKKVDGVEMTTIPTSGISVGKRQYMSYMSVRHWGPPGVWDTNYQSIAYSDDNGETWSTEGSPRWTNNADGTDPFQMGALAKHGNWVYFYGTPNGRSGTAHVSRVPQDQILNKDAYQYWNGSTWATGSDAEAATIVDAHVSELSVQYNTYTKKWLMVYLQDSDIVLRSADAPQGPWSAPSLVASSADFPQLYGGFMHPWSQGPNLYLSISEFGPYDAYLAKIMLTKDAHIINPNLVQDPSFERQTTDRATSPWTCTGNCGVDNFNWAFTGTHNGYLRFNSGYQELKQTVPIEKHTEYVMRGWLRSSANNDAGTIGIRSTDGTVIRSDAFGSLPGWTPFTIKFNSSTHDQVELFTGINTDHGDMWVQLDEFSIAKVTPNSEAIS